MKGEAQSADMTGPGPSLPIHLAGNSGCQIRVQRRGASVAIEKTAPNAAYSPRLKLQVAKQKSIIERGLPAFIRVPRILAERENDGVYTAEMEYVYFQSSIQFFAAASRPSVDAVARMLLAFLDAEVARSPLQRVPQRLFSDKIESVAAELKRIGSWPRYEGCVTRLSHAVMSSEAFELPMGECHGDLTFSNVMIASDASALALIDFLDSFIDSPIADIAKIHQDTRFHWTTLFDASVGSNTRFSQVMNYLDAKVVAHFHDQRWYANSIDRVLFLNMLRIAPYAQSETVHQFLLRSMESMRLNDD